MGRWSSEDEIEARLRSWQRREPPIQRTAPPLGVFVTKSWLVALEIAVRNGRAAEALHMLALKRSEPLRMPSLAECAE